MKNILILGYYFQKNWGDDLFKNIFDNYIFEDKSNYNVVFKSLEPQNIDYQEKCDVVIIGGGDIINDHFLNEITMNTLQKAFTDNGIPILFVGIGLTYPSTINYLDAGDSFWIRNKHDYEIVKNRFSKDFVNYTPDIGFALCKNDSFSRHQEDSLGKRPKVGICLPYTWIAENEDEKGVVQQYNNILRDTVVNDIYNVMSNLALRGYDVHMIPFDTSDNSQNSDLILHEKIKQVLKTDAKRYRGDITFVEEQLGVEEMAEYFKKMSFIIGSRFHSIVLAMITNTPFVSFYTTEKIKKLAKEQPQLGNSFIDVKIHENLGIPVNLPVKKVVNEIMSYDNAKWQSKVAELKNISAKYYDLFQVASNSLREYIGDCKIRKTPPKYIGDIEVEAILLKVIKNVVNLVGTRANLSQVDQVMRGESLLRIIPKQNSTNLDSIRKTLTEEILWTITGDPMSPYYYGLFESIFKPTFLTQVQWIIRDFYSNFKYRVTPDHLTVLNKNFQTIHRSGWQYIIDDIITNTDILHADFTKDIIIDTYVDKTFHWNSLFYQSKGIIPFKKDWVGFIHHTYSDYNNIYNCESLFTNKLFLDSLEYCKSLIVLSQDLKSQIEKSLTEINSDIKVVCLTHPTETPPVLFKWESFVENTDRKVVHVGNWLRDMFSIYDLNLLPGAVVKTKAILKNNNSDAYFPPLNFLENFKKFLSGTGTDIGTSTNIDMCRISFENMYLKGLYDHVQSMQNSVDVIEHLENDNYDSLLSKNIVFLNLIDASAVNTLIECVVRNTPILINPLPAVVEILGEDYPLYYSNLEEASILLKNSTKIKSAYQYIKSLDKEKLSLDYFSQQFADLLKSFVKK